MLNKPSSTYLYEIQPYDSLYKNHYLSFFQIPKLVSIQIAFYLNGPQFKYLLYSLLFFQIKTLQKSYLLFRKDLDTEIVLKQGSFYGGKIKLRKKALYSFLTDFQTRLYPALIAGKTYKASVKQIKAFTIQINEIPKGFPEMEVFYNYFQLINNFTITFEMSKYQSQTHLLSQLLLPITLY